MTTNMTIERWDDLIGALSRLDDTREFLVARLRLHPPPEPVEGSTTLDPSSPLHLAQFHNTDLCEATYNRAKRAFIAAMIVAPEMKVEEARPSGPYDFTIDWAGGFYRWVFKPCTERWPLIDVLVFVPENTVNSVVKQFRFYDAGSLVKFHGEFCVKRK